MKGEIFFGVLFIQCSKRCCILVLGVGKMYSRKVVQELGIGRQKEVCQFEKVLVGGKWQKELQEQRGSIGNIGWVLKVGRKYS